jgi:cell division septation protein DedD
MIGPGTAPVRIEVLGPAPAEPMRSRAAASPGPPSAPAHELPPTSYTVEVASLADAGKADHLRQVLARRFPDAFVSPLAASTRRYYRVRIGPYALRAVAVARAERVNRLGYPAIIVEASGP